MMKKRREIFSNRWQSLMQFPSAHLALVFLMGVEMREIYHSMSEILLIKLVAACLLTLLIAVLGSVYVLHQKPCKNRICYAFWGSQLLAILCWIWYFFLVEESFVYSENLFQYGILLLLVLVIFAVIAFLMWKNEKKIWYSWTSIFQSLAFWLLAGIVVWGGLSAAILSIEKLFELDFSSNLYWYFGAFSFVLLGGSFVFNHYLFALKQMSVEGDQDIDIEESRTGKIFGGYIFLPLAFVYLAIFLAYGVKILVSGIWPKGIIVMLGIGFFVWWILTIYAIFPQKWQKFELLRKILFCGFLFVAIMMAMALGQRILQYGISINRYFIMILILFIIIFSLFSLIFPKNIFRILISFLFGLSVLSLYGPLSATNISFRSQKNQLETVLMKNDIDLPLKSWSLKKLKWGNIDRINNLLKDFDYMYSKTEWEPLFDRECQKEIMSESLFCTWIDLANVREETYFSVNSDYDAGFIADIAGYSKLYSLSESDSKSSSKSSSYEFTFWNKKYELDFSPYWDELYQLHDKRIVNKPVLEIKKSTYKIIIDSISWEKDDSGKNIINYFNGYLLVK